MRKAGTKHRVRKPGSPDAISESSREVREVNILSSGAVRSM